MKPPATESHLPVPEIESIGMQGETKPQRKPLGRCVPTPPIVFESLPGDRLVEEYRQRIRKLFRRPGQTTPTTPAKTIAAILQKWRAFNRSWVRRLLPPLVEASERPTECAALAAPQEVDKDPVCTGTPVRLQAEWEATIEEVIQRGNRLKVARRLPEGIVDLIGDVFIIAARRWPTFAYDTRERATRWLVRILRFVALRVVNQRRHQSFQDNFAAPIEASLTPVSEGAEIMARLEVLNGTLDADCRLTDLDQRMKGISSLQLFVVAEAIYAVLRFNSCHRKLWALLALRRQSIEEVAERFQISTNLVKVQFHRLRMRAIARLATQWQ